MSLFTKRTDVLPQDLCEVSKQRESGLDTSNCSEIRQAPRQQHCRNACQISERYDNHNFQPRGLEISRDLAVRGITTYQIEAQAEDVPRGLDVVSRNKFRLNREMFHKRFKSTYVNSG